MHDETVSTHLRVDWGLFSEIMRADTFVQAHGDGGHESW